MTIDHKLEIQKMQLQTDFKTKKEIENWLLMKEGYSNVASQDFKRIHLGS